MEEVWKDIKGFEGKYQISNKGRVKRNTRFDNRNVILPEKILSPYYNKGGYLYIDFEVNGVKTRHAIHRLIAQAFIPNPYNYPIINHINEIKDDNRIENLEWCTHSYNLSYGHRAEKALISRKTNNSRTQQLEVEQRDLNGNLIATFVSISDASRQTNISCWAIWQSCNKGHITNKQFKWNYKKQ